MLSKYGKIDIIIIGDRMLNKKGFTVIEVVVSFTFVVIILTSMFAVVINYQNKTDKERLKSNLLVFKNNVLEIVYSDIIKGNMENISSCGDKCITINTKTESFTLEAGMDADGNEYLNYRDYKYILPDSQNGLSTINDFEFNFDAANDVYQVLIPVIHAELTDEENREDLINIVVSGKELASY